MPSASTIDPALLDALYVTEVRDVEAFAELTRQRARATDGGSVTYRARNPDQVPDGTLPLTTFGNVPLGNLLFSAISDQVDTEVEIVGEHPLALCITAVLRGRFAVTPAGSNEASETGDLQLHRIEPGIRAATDGRCERINLFVNLKRLERDIEHATGAPLNRPLLFAPERSWPAGVAGSLRRLVTHVTAELMDPHSLLAGGVGIDAFEDLLARTLLEGVPHNHSEAMGGSARPVSRAAVRKARDLIREGTARLPVGTIAAQVGCSPRSLAAAFQSEFGQSLVAAQRNARLDAAHRLLRSGTGLRVRDVAAQLGFSNVGRFSRQYRERFGRRP